MSDWAKAALRWARNLFDEDSAPEKPISAGQPALAPGEVAIVALEAMACEALAHGEALSARIITDQETSGPSCPDHNVFGRSVHDAYSGSARGAVASAAGLSITGVRAAAFISGGRLHEVRDQIEDAATRALPLVIHAICGAMSSADAIPDGSHEGYHAVADAGAFMLMPHNAQQAVDLTLVARQVAEQALVPGVLAMDGAELARAVQDVRLPEASMMRSTLGRPEDTIDTPTPGQKLLWGEARRRVPAWFDLERPATSGAILTGTDAAASRAGRAVYFGQQVRSLAKKAMEDLGEKTGRPLDWVVRDGPEDAPYIIVAQGASVELVRAVAAHLRKTDGLSIGVLGITWLRPFPVEEVRSALARARVITVIEKVDDALAGSGPLMREVRQALGDHKVLLLSATHGAGLQPLSTGDLDAVVRNMSREDRAHPRVWLGLHPPVAMGEYPKRDILLEGLHRAAPHTGNQLLEARPPLDVRPEGARTIALYAHREFLHEEALQKLAELMQNSVGHTIRTRSTVSVGGLWCLRVTAAPEQLLDPGGDGPVDAVIFTSLDLPAAAVSLNEVCEGGAVVVLHPASPSMLWMGLPKQCRDAIHSRKLRLYRVSDPNSSWLSDAVTLALLGETGSAGSSLEDSGHKKAKLVKAGLEQVDWHSLALDAGSHADQGPPLAVRRFQGIGTTFDNVPRFWGEVFEPRLEGGHPDPIPDPYLAIGAIPSGSSTFHDRTPGRATLPEVDPALCTGCGRCWIACPDAAISPVALPTQSWLEAAGERAANAFSEGNPALDKLKRAFKQLASRLDGQWARGGPGSVTETSLREAFDWLLGKMAISPDDRPDFSGAFDAILAELAPLGASVTEPLFITPHKQAKGSGALLLLAINPQSCQGCGACAANCGEDAIRVVTQDEVALQRMRAGWTLWEQLPDTPGEVIERSARHEEVGPLASVMMSRACLMTTAGGDGAEPGSGERLTVRLATAVIEYQRQRQQAGLLSELESASQQLRSKIQSTLSGGLDEADLLSLDRALRPVAGQKGRLRDLLEALEGEGTRIKVDIANISSLVESAQRVESERWRLMTGASGIGRARFGILLAGESVASWAARFPHNPFSVPVTVDLSGTGPEQALGIAEGMLLDATRVARAKRLAQLHLSGATNLKKQAAELEGLSWRDLTDDERAVAPPILVLAGADALTGRGLEGLSRILDSDLPVKVLLLDSRDLSVLRSDPALWALAHRNVYVAAVSVSHPDHFHQSLSEAMVWSGPALIHAVAPSPAEHGFPMDRAVSQCRMAVVSRVHPLLSYNPSAPGSFGQRISLDGNPESDRLWARDGAGDPVTPAHHALGEQRYTRFFHPPDERQGPPVSEWAQQAAETRRTRDPLVEDDGGSLWQVDPALADRVAERAQHWRTLLELSGLETPFTEQVRAEVSAELAVAQSAAIEDLKTRHAAELEQVRAQLVADQAVRLRERLMELAGYGGNSPPEA